jgi:hypothetical protein
VLILVALGMAGAGVVFFSYWPFYAVVLAEFPLVWMLAGLFLREVDFVSMIDMERIFRTSPPPRAPMDYVPARVVPQVEVAEVASERVISLDEERRKRRAA